MAMLTFVIAVAVISSIDFTVEGGECCKGYDDIYGDWQEEQWCSDYCCYTYSIGSLVHRDFECCSNYLRRASSSYRIDSCAEWWSDHAWAPVLISIGCIAAITLCCFGCFKLCSNNNNRTGVVVTNHQQPGVVVVSSHQQQMQSYPSSSVQNPAAYPPGAYPGGPPPYDMGVPTKAQYNNPL